MTPSHGDGDPLDLDVGVDVTVTRSRPPAAADAHLVRFVPDVTPAAAEAVLGALTPPEEGILLAGQGAVIVRAGEAFVERAEASAAVDLVSALRLPDRDPPRVQVPAED
jgi:glyoxylate carboligase